MSKEVIVKFNRAGLMGFENIKLLPGANKISEEMAQKMLKHPVIKAQIEAGEIEFPENISVEKGIKDLKPKEALSLIGETVDVKILESWKASEKREPILSAIDEQLKKLAAPAERRSDKKE